MPSALSLSLLHDIHELCYDSMASLGALSALWTVASFLYNVIDKVKENTSECKETLDLVFLFIYDIEQSGIQNVSPPMQERIARLLRFVHSRDDESIVR